MRSSSSEVLRRVDAQPTIAVELGPHARPALDFIRPRGPGILLENFRSSISSIPSSLPQRRTTPSSVEYRSSSASHFLLASPAIHHAPRALRRAQDRGPLLSNPAGLSGPAAIRAQGAQVRRGRASLAVTGRRHSRQGGGHDSRAQGAECAHRVELRVA